ncbi:hypothetical protein ACHAXR_002190 [Thalassiosira sp. AJA248-18]
MSAEEDPFELIAKGNAFESASDHWRSAEFYSRASICLRSQADGLSSQIRKGGQVDRAADAEKRKVVSLFRAQSLEYMYKARYCLLEALRFENDQDRSRTLEVAKSGTGSLDPLFSMISHEESEKRKLTFERLFSGRGEALECKTDAGVADVEIQADTLIEPIDESVEMEYKGEAVVTSSESAPTTANEGTVESSENLTESAPTGNEIDDRRQSIESRLAELDSSLLPNVPPPFISGSRSTGGGDNKNRLEEIKRGLGRLGVSLPDSGKKSDLLPENLSAEDQVKLIIQQANDEVQFEKGLHGEGVESNGLVGTAELVDDDVIDENDSMFEGFDDEDDDIEALLAKAETLVAKTGAEVDGEFSSELIQIRKVQALLLEARLCLEMVQAKSSDEQKFKQSEDDKIKEDMSDDSSGDSVQSSDHGSRDTGLAARKKARELVENAQDSMKKLLKDWKNIE